MADPGKICKQIYTGSWII